MPDFRKPLLAALFCALTFALPVWAQTYKDSSGTSVPGINQIPATVGGSASLAVTSSSGAVAIPASDLTYPALNLTNSGSNALFYALGASATPSSAYLGAGSSACIAAGSATQIAAITTSSTTTLQVTQSNACIVGLGGGGGGGAFTQALPFIDPANPPASLGVAPVLPGAGDQTANLNALMAALQTAGTGGTVQFHPGTYLFSGCIVLPNDVNGSSSTYSHQTSIRWTGTGQWKTGESGSLSGGTALNFTGNCSNGKIVTLGIGHFEYDHLILENTGNSDGQRYVFTTGTSIYDHEVSYLGSPNVANATANQDAVVYGGLTAILSNTVSAPFQGYGSISENNFYMGMRRGHYFRVYANGIYSKGHTVWKTSGSNLLGVKTVSAIASPGSGFVVGNLIQLAGGTCDVQPILRVASVSGGGVVTTNIFNDGSCTVFPSNPVAQNATNGTGSGATFTLTSGLTGAFDEVDPDPSFNQAGVGTTTGNDISLPIVEMPAYAYAAKLVGGAFYNRVEASSYDAVANNPSLAMVHTLYGANYNHIIELSPLPSSLPALVDENSLFGCSGVGCANTNLVLAPIGNSVIPTLSAGSVTANSVLCNGLGPATCTVQPAAHSINVLLQVLASFADSSTVLWSVDGNGAQIVGGINGGNITNSVSNGGSFSVNARTWSANGTGGAMTQNSGSGGSNFTLKNNAVVFQTQAGTPVGQIGPGVLTGTGSRPLCVTSTGVFEPGTLSSGLTTCP